MLALRQTVKPAVEPVSLIEAQSHLKAEGAPDTPLISRQIAAARELCEARTLRQLVTATWRLTLDRFPVRGESVNRPAREHGDAIIVPRPPLQSVTSVEYVDTDGQTQTLDASKYRVDTASEPGRITPAHGTRWPTTQCVTGAVTVTFVAGYGLAADVPESFKAAMLLLVGHWYENREVILIGSISKELELTVDALLAPYRIHYL